MLHQINTKLFVCFKPKQAFRLDNKHHRVLHLDVISSSENKNKVIKCGLLTIALFCQVLKWFTFREFLHVAKTNMLAMIRRVQL